MLNRQGNLFMCGTFLIRLLPYPNNRGQQPQWASFLVFYASFCNSQLMGLFWLTKVRFGSLNRCEVRKLRDELRH